MEMMQNNVARYFRDKIFTKKISQIIFRLECFRGFALTRFRSRLNNRHQNKLFTAATLQQIYIEFVILTEQSHV